MAQKTFFTLIFLNIILHHPVVFSDVFTNNLINKDSCIIQVTPNHRNHRIDIIILGKVQAYILLKSWNLNLIAVGWDEKYSVLNNISTYL